MFLSAALRPQKYGKKSIQKIISGWLEWLSFFWDWKGSLCCVCKLCTLIKTKIKFSYCNIQWSSEWSSCKVIYEEGLPNIWGNAQIFPHLWEGPLVIYDFATMLHFWISSYMRKTWFSFCISVHCCVYMYREPGNGPMEQPWTIQIGGLASQKLAFSGTVWSCTTINFG